MIFTKSFGPLIFECRLPKETSLSIWGTFTMFPIPPSSTTLVTEFFEERGKMDFPHFLVFYLARWFHMLLNPHQLPKQTIWYAWNYFGVPPYMCTGVTLVTENPFTGRKAQKCPNVLKEHNNNVKHSAKLVIPIFNPLHHTRDFFASSRGPNDYFGPRQPFWKSFLNFAYFEMAKNPSKSGKRIKLKSIPSFLGDV